MLWASMPLRQWSRRRRRAYLFKVEDSHQNTVNAFASACLGFDAVFAAEHVVDVLEVVDTAGDGFGVAGGGVVLLEMCLLAEVAHL